MTVSELVPGVSFSEKMRGAVGFGQEATRIPPTAVRQLVLDLEIWMQNPPQRPPVDGQIGSVTGRVVCDALGGRLSITAGRFVQFCEVPDGLEMRYWLQFYDSTEHPLTLYGVKLVHNDPGQDADTDTTTLWVVVRPGMLPLDIPLDFISPGVVAAGSVRISALGSLRILTSFRAHHPTWWGRLGQTFRFARFWLSRMWREYGPGSPN